MSGPEPVVFVVDDNRSVREAITSLLASVGLRAETFRMAEEFLQAQQPDAPACLVLDVRLPGLSGLDLQQRLIATSQHIPIIFITAHGDRPRARGDGARGGAVSCRARPPAGSPPTDV